MTKQPLLPASPRAVASVSQGCVCITAAAFAALATDQNEDKVPSPVPEEMYVTKEKNGPIFNARAPLTLKRPTTPHLIAHDVITASTESPFKIIAP